MLILDSYSRIKIQGKNQYWYWVIYYECAEEDEGKLSILLCSKTYIIFEICLKMYERYLISIKKELLMIWLINLSV
jgi:hypothetical protein